MNSKISDSFSSSAYGGRGWVPRERTHEHELGEVWAACGIDSEWKTLRAVLLHAPGDELNITGLEPDDVQMLARIDVSLAREEHNQLAETYRQHGVDVYALEPSAEVSPNQMFCADLFAMTPQGAVLARPASEIRKGEERVVARRLAEIGIPVLKTLTGSATFEGADLIWVNRESALLGLGLRTNRSAFEQIVNLMSELGINLTGVDMPYGTMHLMGMLRIVDRDLAIAWPRRTPHAAVTALREAGYNVAFLPESEETDVNRAFNFVTLGPRRILMVDGNPRTRAFYESIGIECIASRAKELAKAAGAIGCLTGVLMRDR